MAEGSGPSVYRCRFATIVSDEDVETFRADLDRLVSEADAVRLAVDLTSTFHINSKVLGTLARLSKQVRGTRGRMVLFGINPAVEKVIRVTQLDKIIPVATDEARAMELLTRPLAS